MKRFGNSQVSINTEPVVKAKIRIKVTTTILIRLELGSPTLTVDKDCGMSWVRNCNNQKQM